MKIIKITSVILLLLGLAIILGPRQKYAPAKLLDTDISAPMDSLEALVAAREAAVPGLKPGNQAAVVWADPVKKQKTEYALVYLPGFSASHEEGAPIHTDFARRYGLNLYLARLEDHGRADTNSFVNLTPESYLQSAEDAIDIGKKLGNKVIVMSCSTGGTLSAILAAAGEDIHAMVMYSPNIDIYDPMSELLLYPWGKNVAEIFFGGSHNRISYDTTAMKYWNSVYHINGTFVVKTLIKDYMNKETFGKIKCPVYMGYYYKDEENQDKVVSVKRMLEFFDQLGTPDSLKTKMAFPESGNHVISSYVMSKDIVGLEESTFGWAEKTLGLKPVPAASPAR